MRSEDGCVIAPLVHCDGPYSLEHSWNTTPSQHDFTLLRLNRLEFCLTSASWTKQPLMFRQSQPLASRLRFLSLSRDIEYTRNNYPGISLGQGSLESTGRRGVFQGQASLELSRKLRSLQVSPESSRGFTFLLRATYWG